MTLGEVYYAPMHEAAESGAYGLWRRHVETAIQASAVDCWRECKRRR